MAARASLVKNSANEKQRDYADRKEQRKTRERFALVASQLSTAAGRAFVWAELERHGIDDLANGGSAEDVYRFLGKRDAGMALKIELMTEHPDAFLLMQAEAMQRIKRDAVELEAVQSETAKEDA